jgi:hypothetical protein
VQQDHYVRDTFVELCKHRLVEQPLQNLPLSSKTANTHLKGKAWARGLADACRDWAGQLKLTENTVSIILASVRPVGLSRFYFLKKVFELAKAIQGFQ